MARYIGILKNKNSSLLSKNLVIEHIEHLRRMKEEGMLLFCGPLTQLGEAIQMLSAKSYDEALTNFLKDPFIRDGYYPEYIFSEFVEANDENNYLIDNMLKALQ